MLMQNILNVMSLTHERRLASGVAVRAEGSVAGEGRLVGDESLIPGLS